ncbi:MAG: type III secretion inner membrane ring lipoprotein SctJ [Candidatus Accumulibacter sp.]|jgi:type III secretion protein J|nr:type III secretion inner membrane ring lipoprotein SctJ [Accumulibacter sp.]
MPSSRSSSSFSARLRKLALGVGLLFLLGCQQELYSGLPEDEANRILATLLENGMDAKKVSRGKNGFTISVEKTDLVRALKILENHSLPRENFKNLGDVFAGQGMIASPTEEQARLAFAIEQELAGTFARIDGVLTARAHVVLERHDAATGTVIPASAAVFLRHRPDSPVADLQGKIKEVCVRAVPGLVYDKVSVMLVPVRAEVLLPDSPPTAEAAKTFLPEGLLEKLPADWLQFARRQTFSPGLWGALLAVLLVFLAGSLVGFRKYRQRRRAGQKKSV